MFSARLTKEYEAHVRSPRNDFIKAFLDLIADTTRWNWKKRAAPVASSRHFR